MTLDNPWPLAAKASFAAMLAYLLCEAMRIPDGLSGAFVAVVCVTPTVIAGLRRALGQGVGSVIGGVLAAGLMSIGLPTALSLGLSVGGAVMAVHALGFWRAHVVAAFTAIYVHLLPLGEPGETLWVRVMAIAVGALAAMTVNALISAMFYERIFDRRITRVKVRVAEGADGIDGGHLTAMVPAFEILGALSAELAQADRELKWRGNTAAGNAVRSRRKRVRALLRVAHFVHDLGLTVDEAAAELNQVDRQLLRHVATRLRNAPSEAPTGVGEVGTRVLAAMQRYEDAVQT